MHADDDDVDCVVVQSQSDSTRWEDVAATTALVEFDKADLSFLN